MGLVGLSGVLFFLTLASSDLIPDLNGTWVWLVSGALTAVSIFLFIHISGRDG